VKKLSILFVLALLAGSVGCARPTPQLTHIRLPMGFVASVQFAPVYVAIDKGYFAAEGIEIEFDYSWETNGVQLVGAGELPFAIASGDQVILARSQGLPIVTFVNWWKRFPVAVVALKDSGIRTPQDLVGRKVGIPETFGASYIGWRALASQFGLSDTQLEVIGYGALAKLTEEQVEASVVYANNEPIQLAQAGYEYTLIPVADYATLVSNGLITNERTLQENPDLVRAFARAFLKGLADALAKPDAAFEICKRYVDGLDANAAAQRAVLQASLAYWQGQPLGASDPAVWQATADVMLEAGLLTAPLDAGQAFTNDYLP
jgi:NitT/TauT family transport system substrate-binding protein